MVGMALLQAPPSAHEMSKMTEQFGYATAANIAFMVVFLGLAVYMAFVHTRAMRDLQLGQAQLLNSNTAMLENMRIVLQYVLKRNVRDAADDLPIK